MTKTVEMLKARIHLLTQRDEVGNMHIINKLKREVRNLEQK